MPDHILLKAHPGFGQSQPGHGPRSSPQFTELSKRSFEK
jgi:hypothetical protein